MVPWWLISNKLACSSDFENAHCIISNILTNINYILIGNFPTATSQSPYKSEGDWFLTNRWSQIRFSEHLLLNPCQQAHTKKKQKNVFKFLSRINMHYKLKIKFYLLTGTILFYVTKICFSCMIAPNFTILFYSVLKSIAKNILEKKIRLFKWFFHFKASISGFYS